MLAGLTAAAILFGTLGPGPAGAAEPAPQHALAMYGEPKYPPGFEQFGWVNPEAPKGGRVTLSAIGSFDTLNPFTVRGVPAAGLGLIYDTLMIGSDDEPFTQYPLVAESVTVPEDRSWVEFTLRPEARFHDGQPITPEDVIFTFETLREAHPFYAAYYGNVERVEKTGDHGVRFTFRPGDNRELPLILGQLPVLPKHYWEGRNFEATTLEPPVGSGPYRIASVDPGRSIGYERVADYWGKDLPVNVGRHNFGRMQYDYYRDATVAIEAFKAGLIDFRQENIAKNWATAYNIPEVRSGKIRKEEIKILQPAGMQGFVFNTRRPIFADPRVRQAIAHAFDFEWANENLFYGAYKRTDSYFENSELEAEGLPSPEELAILEPLRGQIPEEVFTADYEPPSAAGRGGLRSNLVKAVELLEQAGWVVRNGQRVNAETGQPLTFEILLDSPSFERIALPFVSNLKRLGITAAVRTVDTAQFTNRVQNFDYDMIVNTWGQSLSPGNEQRDFWGSEAADRPGSRNYAGIKDPAVDQLVELLIQAKTREELVTRARALDRVLLQGHYVVPHWYTDVVRVAYWDKLQHPEDLPAHSIAFDSWWVDPKAAPPPKEGAAAMTR